MKTALLEIEATLSNAIAQLSMPNPNAETAKRGVEVARKKLLELAENQSDRDPLLEAKRKLVLVYLGMAENRFTGADAEIFSILSKERALQDELERARKNNCAPVPAAQEPTESVQIPGSSLPISLFVCGVGLCSRYTKTVVVGHMLSTRE